MTNELQLLPNPDNIPGAVSTGYQRQNTNFFALQTGLDTTEPYDNGSVTITIPAGGIVEINGSLFKLPTTVTLTRPEIGIIYWVAASDNGNGTANLSLVTRPGVWNPAKQGCYTSSNVRTLNWVSLGTPANLTENAIFAQTTKGTWTLNLQKGWYYANLRSGLGNGAGGDTGAGGGVATVSSSAQKVFFSNETIIIKIGGSGGNGESGGDGDDGGGGGGGCPGGTPNGGKSGGGGRGANFGRGGYYGGGNGVATSSGGGGGGQGLNGEDQASGTTGGYCNIYKLGN